MKKLISILFIGTATLGYAQTNTVDVDAAYFHPAASMYIHGDMAGASNLVTQGLSVFPEDGKLLRLKELLKQQQEQNQNQQNQDQQQDQQQNDDQQPEQENPQNQNDQEQNQNQENEQNPEQQNAEAESQPRRAEQMSQDEAKQLLDAMKQEEETERMQLHPVMGAPVKVDKDW